MTPAKVTTAPSNKGGNDDRSQFLLCIFSALYSKSQSIFLSSHALGLSRGVFFWCEGMRSKILSVRLSPEETKWVDELSRQWGCPKADVLRWSFRLLLLEANVPAAMSELRPSNDG